MSEAKDFNWNKSKVDLNNDLFDNLSSEHLKHAGGYVTPSVVDITH